MIPLQAERAWRGTADCQHCGVRAMVLFADLCEEDFRLIHEPIDDFHFRAGETLYVGGPPAQSVFTVRTGMIKLLRNTPAGRQRILRVLRPGDVAGLEALAGDAYDSDAVALTHASVCRIPVELVHRLDRNAPHVHRMLLQKWHDALRQADNWLAEINFGTARQRVRSLAQCMRHPSDPTLTTLFAREDMGAMTGLQLETVSREVSAMVKEGVLEPLDKAGRVYRILDDSRLLEPSH